MVNAESSDSKLWILKKQKKSPEMTDALVSNIFNELDNGFHKFWSDSDVILKNRLIMLSQVRT